MRTPATSPQAEQALVAAQEHAPPDGAALRAVVRRAVESGDSAILRLALFESPVTAAARQAWVIKPEAASALLEGFHIRDSGDVHIMVSLAELCLANGRLRMFTEVLSCARPASIDGWPTASDTDWLRFLCTCDAYGNYEQRSLIQAACWEITAHSRDFIMLALAADPEPPGLDELKQSPEAAALIAECEMALQLRNIAAAARAPANVSDPTAPRARRMSL